MSVKHIEHITITTGASRLSARREVNADTIAFIRTALAEKDGRLDDSGWVVTIIPTPEGGHVYDLIYHGALLARCWLCVSDDVSDAMWGAASAQGILPGTRLHRPVTTPWLAVTLLPAAIAVEPGILLQLGDLERCVAWALLD